MLYPGPIVVIGCSHGGVLALRDLTGAFDPRWRTSVFITIHIGRRESYLPELLNQRCPMPVLHARNREMIERGRVYVAPPDRHLCIEPGYMRLRGSCAPLRGAWRPSLDAKSPSLL